MIANDFLFPRREEKIKYLTYRKFPSFFWKEEGKIEFSHNKISPSATDIRHHHQIKEYENNFLQIKNNEELLELYIAEKEIEEEEEEKNYQEKKEGIKRLFNTTPNYEYWSKKPSWRLEEAVTLSFGKDPYFVNLKSFLPGNAYAGLEYVIFNVEYFKRFELLKPAFDIALIYPPAFIRWLEDKEIDFPKALKEPFEKSLDKEVRKKIELLIPEDLEKEKEYFYQKLDYKYWLRMPHLTIEEAVVLILGKDPQVIKQRRIECYRYTPDEEAEKRNYLDFWKEYLKCKKIIYRKFFPNEPEIYEYFYNCNKEKPPVANINTQELIKWVKEIDIELPQQLREFLFSEKEKLTISQITKILFEKIKVENPEIFTKKIRVAEEIKKRAIQEGYREKDLNINTIMREMKDFKSYKIKK